MVAGKREKGQRPNRKPATNRKRSTLKKMDHGIFQLPGNLS